jgi:hypothetical protein
MSPEWRLQVWYVIAAMVKDTRQSGLLSSGRANLRAEVIKVLPVIIHRISASSLPAGDIGTLMLAGPN